jgi:hypothetical protein
MEHTPQQLGRTEIGLANDERDDIENPDGIENLGGFEGENEGAIEENAAPDSSHRTEPWIDAFDSQLDDETIERVIAFARPRAFYVGCAGRKVDDYYARELVQDAIGDTWMGRLAWDPSRVSLKTHLLRAVQCRTKDEHKRALALPHDTLGDGPDDAAQIEYEASATVAGGKVRAEVSTYTHEVLAQIRQAARDDRHVLRIVDAICAGAYAKIEILEHAKMNARTYVNAQVRLRKIIRTLSNEQTAPKLRA